MPEAIDEWYLCGPMAMVEDLRSTLGEVGVDPRRVHRELFYTGNGATGTKRASRIPGRSSASACQVTIRLDGRESTFELDPARETILDGALGVRDDAPYACRSGVCATCRASLVEGAVEMDHEYALEEDQKASGYVLTCQSHPTSQRVIVDYDA